jgi:endonuclease YncB( thermonuclease family)
MVSLSAGGPRPLYGLGGALQKSIAWGQARRRSLAYARGMRRALLSLLLLLCGVAAARADDTLGPSDGLDYGPPVAVAAVLDGRTVRLGDGTVVRLSGLDVPFGRWQATARSVLAALVDGQPVRLAPVAPADRYGRVPGHLQRADGLWIEEDLLDRGLARVDAGGADPAAALVSLLVTEGEARAAGRGLWADPDFTVRPAAALDRAGLDRFQVVEGTVLQATILRGRAYLNFGTDQRQDFTVMMEPDAVRRLGAGPQLLALQGRRIRVRGWLDWSGGPRIAVGRMEQIERLD